MGKKWLFLLAMLVFCRSGYAVCAGEPKLYDINGGFEKGVEVTKYEGEYRKWAEQGIKLPEVWVRPYGWYPNCPDWTLEVVTDEKAAHSGKNFLKMTGTIYYQDDRWYVLEIKENYEITVKVWAKDPNRATFKVMFYQYTVNEEVAKGSVPAPRSIQSSPVLINEAAVPEWKQYTAKYVVPKAVPQVRRVNIVLIGNGTWFDDVEVEIK
ncbi:MAG: hypothetical protein WC552_09580 [Candidatus Omnitrophota bacterium]